MEERKVEVLDDLAAHYLKQKKEKRLLYFEKQNLVPLRGTDKLINEKVMKRIKREFPGNARITFTDAHLNIVFDKATYKFNVFSYEQLKNLEKLRAEFEKLRNIVYAKESVR